MTVTTRRSLLEVRKTLRLNWYRCPIDPAAFRELMEPCDYKGWLQAAGHLVVFCLTGCLTIYLFLVEEWFWLVFSLFFHGIVGSFFKGLAAHELGHGSVFKTKTLNAIFLRIYSIVSWHNFHEYAVSHTYHHRYTLYEDGDRE